MALSDSGGAIGAVTLLLQDHLIRRGFDVSIGKPEKAADSNNNAKLNLFLFETGFDPHLRNHSLRDGEPAPLWLVLRYLLTAFDAGEDSDSAAAHELLGRGISALNDLNFLALDGLVTSSVRRALENNPEPLKLTFDETTAELLSKIMQGSQERYRLSMAFQMRPVMIMTGVTPRPSLLVGVDYTPAPNTVIGQKGVDIDVRVSFGPQLDRIEPAAFEAGGQFEIHGDELGGADLEVVLGSVVLTIASRRPGVLIVTAEGSPGTPIASGAAISAGERPLVVRRRLLATRTRSSNLLAARLLPTLSGATMSGEALVLTGSLLGNDADDVVVTLEQDGVAVRLFDVVATSSNQQTLTVAAVAGAVPAGNYRVILRVNNQQARSSPTVAVP
jgi:hypothetical protein